MPTPSRQKVIAGNLANITTPGYKAQSVKFEEELSGALQTGSIPGVTTDPRHMPIGANNAANDHADGTDVTGGREH